VDRMNGWYEIQFREVGTKRRRIFNLDELVRLTAKNPIVTASLKRKQTKRRPA
jgi:hypothetical protein